jgi:predicted O-methyltransferase YrrM
MHPDSVLKRIEKQAPRRGLPIIGPERGKVLDEVMESYAPSRVLEVGTLVGYSAIRMARHLSPGGRLTCIDIDEKIAEEARSNIEDAGLSGVVRVLVGDAKKLIPSIEGPLDLVFLDATKTEYLIYLRACEPKLHKGSVIVADNVKSHIAELGDYLGYVRGSGGYSSSYREAPPNQGSDYGDAVEISVRL